MKDGSQLWLRPVGVAHPPMTAAALMSVTQVVTVAAARHAGVLAGVRTGLRCPLPNPAGGLGLAPPI